MHFKYKDIEIKSKWMEKIYHANINQKKAELAILILDRADFQAWKVNRDKEEQYIMIKGSIVQEDIAILNV